MAEAEKSSGRGPAGKWAVEGHFGGGRDKTLSCAPEPPLLEMGPDGRKNRLEEAKRFPLLLCPHCGLL